MACFTTVVACQSDQSFLQLLFIFLQLALIPYQRFISILLEQTQGKLPFWLSPLQVVLIPVFNNKNKEKIIKYCDNLKSKLNSIVRIEIWKEKWLNYQIRKIHQLQIPSYIVIGEKEVDYDLLNYVYKYENKKIESSELNLIDKLNSKIDL